MATYKWQRSGQRIKDRLATPQGGPLVAPSDRFPRRGPSNMGASSRSGSPPPPGHKPVLDMKPDGTLAPMGWRQGTSLPGYKPRGKIPPEVLRGLDLGIETGLDLMPLGRMARGVKGAFDLIQGLDWFQDWAYQQPSQETLPQWNIPGATMVCGEPPDPALSACNQLWFAQNTGNVPYEFLCRMVPLPGQVIPCCGDHSIYQNGTMTGPTGALPGMSHFYAGYTTLPVGGECIRVTITQYIFSGQPVSEFLPFSTGTPARAWPLPFGAPPAPALVEETSGRRANPSRRAYKPWKRLRPYEQPAVEFGQVGGRPPSTPTPVAHQRLPPGPNLKEDKRQMGVRAALGVMGKLYDAATEGLELVDIFYDAMEVKPPFRPGKPYNPAEKAAWVYENFDRLNIEKLLAGLAYNKVEDATLGRFMAAVGKHSPFGAQGPTHGGWFANVPL